MIIAFADRKVVFIDECRRLNVRAEIYVGDPLDYDVDGIVSPANMIGEVSGGYDLTIRNRLGLTCERNAQETIRRNPISIGEARAIPTGSRLVSALIVAPTLTRVGGVITNPEIVFVATNAAVHVAHGAGVSRLGMVGIGTGYGGLDIPSAAAALVEAIDDAFDDIVGLPE